MRRERGRGAGTHAQPDATPTPGRGEVQPAGEVNPARTKRPHRQSNEVGQTECSLSAAHINIYETCSLSAGTSTSQVLVVGHICFHMNMCSLSAGTSKGRRPTPVLRHGSFSLHQAISSHISLNHYDCVYHHATEITSQDPNYNICSTHISYFL